MFMYSMYSLVSWGEREKQVSRAHEPVSLATWRVPGQGETLSQKQKVRELYLRNNTQGLPLTSSFARTHTHTHKHAHMQERGKRKK